MLSRILLFSVQVIVSASIIVLRTGMGAFLENSSGAGTVNVYSFIVPFLVEARYLEVFIEK